MARITGRIYRTDLLYRIAYYWHNEADRPSRLAEVYAFTVCWLAFVSICKTIVSTLVLCLLVSIVGQTLWFAGTKIFEWLGFAALATMSWNLDIGATALAGFVGLVGILVSTILLVAVAFLLLVPESRQDLRDYFSAKRREYCASWQVL